MIDPHLDGRIAGVILTLNEEQTIARSLESLAWCDSLHVVDSGSTDRTVAIAKSLGARVHVRRPDGTFLIADQRNWAVDQLRDSCAWVLFLDADEQSTPEFERSVREAVHNSHGVSGFYAAPAIMYHGRWLRRTTGYPNWHPRLCRVHDGARFVGGVWEDFDSQCSTSRIAEPYLHFTNSKGGEEWLAKHIRYAAWEAQRIATPDTGESTPRRRSLRLVRYRLGAFRRYAAIAYLLVWRRGILDGPAGWSYVRRMAQYERMISLISDDLRRQKNGELL